MEFLQLAEKRYSVRNFSEQKVEKDKLDKILRAAQIAPTACNNQPQKVLVLQSEEALGKWSKCSPCSYGATLVILVCADKNSTWKRPFDGKDSADVDGSIVLTHIMLEAEELGIGSTWIMFFDPAKAKEEFNLPDNYEAVGALVMGYPAEDAQPSDKHSDKKPLEDTTFFETL